MSNILNAEPPVASWLIWHLWLMGFMVDQAGGITGGEIKNSVKFCQILSAKETLRKGPQGPQGAMSEVDSSATSALAQQHLIGRENDDLCLQGPALKSFFLQPSIPSITTPPAGSGDLAQGIMDKMKKPRVVLTPRSTSSLEQEDLHSIPPFFDGESPCRLSFGLLHGTLEIQVPRYF